SRPRVALCPGSSQHRQSVFHTPWHPQSSVVVNGVGEAAGVQTRKTNKNSGVVTVWRDWARICRQWLEGEPVEFQDKVAENFARIPKEADPTLGFKNRPKEIEEPTGASHLPAVQRTGKEELKRRVLRWSQTCDDLVGGSAGQRKGG